MIRDDSGGSCGQTPQGDRARGSTVVRRGVHRVSVRRGVVNLYGNSDSCVGTIILSICIIRTFLAGYNYAVSGLEHISLLSHQESIIGRGGGLMKLLHCYSNSLLIKMLSRTHTNVGIQVI